MISVEITLNGVKTCIPCPEGLRVNIEKLDVSDDSQGDLVFNFTHEGVITDCWGSGFVDLLGTSAEMYSDIIDRISVEVPLIQKHITDLQKESNDE